jgi:hypothetical protein
MTKRSGDRVIARDPTPARATAARSGDPGDRVIGTEGFFPSNSPEVLPAVPTPVILSGAPREVFPHDGDGRGVEGPRGSVGLENCIREFSREFPDAAFKVGTSSGSFDSPSRSFGIAQDDKGRELRLENTSFLALAKLHIVFRTIIATVREIFDENAYERFLQRTHTARSVESYGAFLREREAGMARKPRCC